MTLRSGNLPRYIPYSRAMLLALLLIGTIVLGADSLLETVERGNLCTTSGCRISGDYVRFGNWSLAVAGFCYFLFLSIILLIEHYRPRPRASALISILFLGGLAFDGGLMGYQYFGIQVRCALCLTVAGLILLSYLCYSLQRKTIAGTVTGFVVWMGAFAVNGALLVSPIPPQLQDVPFYHLQTQAPEFPKHYLFLKVGCSHCRSLVKFFGLNPPKGNWFLATPDRRPDSLQRLARFQGLHNDDNAFLALTEAMERESPGTVSIPKDLAFAADKGYLFVRNSGYHGFPILVIQETEDLRVTISGVQGILGYLFAGKTIQPALDNEAALEAVVPPSHTEQ